ncbi:Calcium-transporting ATPase 2 like protein [Verticillium longisporum]|nr:Calcium-transporting ATPase 2 like protein [Verticillium longisporum]
MVIIWKGGEAFDTKPLTGAQWGWSMLFGVLVIPLGALIRKIPDHYVYSLFQAIKRAFIATRQGEGHLAGRVSSIPIAHREALARAARSSISGTGDIDIVQLVDQARHSKAELAYNIEVHPGTPKEDPFLQTPMSGNGKKVPPSQDPSTLQWLKVGSLAEQTNEKQGV